MIITKYDGDRKSKHEQSFRRDQPRTRITAAASGNGRKGTGTSSDIDEVGNIMDEGDIMIKTKHKRVIHE